MGAWYASREQVKAALDFAETARNDAAVDRAIEAASRQVDRLTNRHRGGFWPEVRTRSFDWPSLAAPTPGRIWLDEPGLITLTAVTSGGTTIPTSAVELYPDAGPPYTRIEIDRTTSYEFGLGSTPQKDVQITGLWGFDLNTAPAGTLAASVSSTTATVLDVSDSSQVGVGDLLTVDAERLLVTGRAQLATSVTLQGGGLAQSPAAVAATLSSGSGVAVGEILTIDSERVRVDDITGNVATVKRAVDGSVLAAHAAGAAVFAPRRLTVTRGAFGTTAATHSNGAAVARHVYPGLVVQLAVAEAAAALQAESAAWARTAGAGERGQSTDALGIAGLRQDVVDAYGRSSRHRAV